MPEWDRTLRLFEHAPTHFAVPPGKGSRYTLIEVTMFAGRSMEAKRSLYKAIVHNLGSLGVPAGDVKITLIEVPPENWGIHGGHPASETSDLKSRCRIKADAICFGGCARGHGAPAAGHSSWMSASRMILIHLS
jgi:phenylpyruvate tautomerase PptA (4-oxalocrotonate tautomerase family)